ncbi:MAG: S8 family serine peptidase, partial [Candidatus Eisenbacteria bacterium]|nr:S8 family serine peptidase [Candidatus Eisenbacteria bacterium]
TRARLIDLGAEIVAPLPTFPGFTLRISDSQIFAMAGLDAVLWISEGLPVPESENDGVRVRIGVEDVQAPPYSLSGAGVITALADGGTVFPHQDFASRFTQVETDAAVAAHSTHVTGTMAGDGALSASRGGAPLAWRGMAPAAQIFGWDYFDDVISEMRDAAGTYAVQVHNDSWGYGVGASNCDIFGDYDFIAPDLDSLVLGSGGRPMTIVFSAGNERDDADCPLTEGGYGCINPPKPAKNILVVGATNSDDDTMTEFSSWGPVDDGRIRPDVCAPGCENGGEGYIHSTLNNDTYGGPGWCGTSMAAAAASGSVALLYEAYNGRYGEFSFPSMLQAMLCDTAVDLGNAGPDYRFGHGRINVRAAARAILADTQVAFDVSQDDVIEFPFHVPGGLIGLPRLVIVLAWDDPDGAPNADPALVNDLDLVLVDPEGTEIRPWVLDPALPSLPAVQGVDSLNNVENISVTTPTPGTWSARVLGTNVPEGPQLASIVGFDLYPPESPDSFEVVGPTPVSLGLTWMQDVPVDFTGNLIVRLEGGAVWDGPVDGQIFSEGEVIEPGVTVIYRRNEDHATVPFVDSGLDPATTYGYVAYAFDDMRTYSPGITTEGTTGSPTSVDPSDSAPRFFLDRPRPNPAGLGDDRVDVLFGLGVAGPARLAIYDPAGRLVRMLVDETLPAGTHSVSWNGRDERGHRVSSGIFFYRLQTGGDRETRQVSWIR